MGRRAYSLGDWVLAHQTMKRLCWSMPAVCQSCRRRSQTRFLSSCASILLSRGPMGMVIRAWFTSRILLKHLVLSMVCRQFSQLHYRVITETGLTTADENAYPSNLVLVDDWLAIMLWVLAQLKTRSTALWRQVLTLQSA